MEITEVRIRPIKQDGKMKAVASVTFDGVFVVHDMKVINGDSGLFVAMPSRKTPSGEYKDVAHPIEVEMRKYIQATVLKEYSNSTESSEEEPNPPKNEPEKKNIFDKLF